MNLIKCFLTHSTWYKGAKTGSKPIGILWHDTGAGNPSLKRYVQPYSGDDNYDKLMSLIGKNQYGNDWNHIEREAGVNAWIGKLSDGSVATIQAGEWERHPWGCGGGNKGSCNGYIIKDGKTTWTNEHWIQFEICDDGYGNEEYFQKAYKEACEFTAYICQQFGIDPKGTVTYNGVTVPTILCHADSYKLGLGGNHGDIYSWFNKYGYTMDNVRNDVATLMNKTTTQPENTITFNKGDVVKLKDGVTTYSNGTKMASWVSNATLYVRDFRDNNCVVISTLKEGDITGVVFATDLILVESAEQKNNAVEVKPSVSGTPSTGSKDDEKIIWNFLLKKLGNEYGVAGLMGNLYAESALRSNNLQQAYEKKSGYTDESYTNAVDNGTYTNFVKDSAGYGLAQWTYWSRKQNLLNFANEQKKSICDLNMQLEFLYQELSCDFKSTLKTLQNATSVLEASNMVLFKFEAPADQGETVQTKRASYGQKYYDAYKTVVVEESPKEEIEEQVPNENVKQNDTNDSSVDNPIEVPDDKTTNTIPDVGTNEQPADTQDNIVGETPTEVDTTVEDDGEPEYIKTTEDAQNFIVKFLNHIIDFIVCLFKK